MRRTHEVQADDMMGKTAEKGKQLVGLTIFATHTMTSSLETWRATFHWDQDKESEILDSQPTRTKTRQSRLGPDP